MVSFACQVPARGNAFGGFADEQEWAESNGVVFASVPVGTAKSPVTGAGTDLELLDVTTDGQPIVSLEHVDMIVDGLAADASTAPVEVTVPQYATDGTPLPPSVFTPTYIGGEVVNSNFSEPWAFGINPNNRREPLWFE